MSSAATTAFCSAQIDTPAGPLFIDGNGKITAGNGTLNEPQPNAFSLPHITTCPGRTSICESSCYVHGLKAAQPDLAAKYEENLATVREMLSNDALKTPVALLVGEWISENCGGGFRWHVSGDIFSLDYADWIARACAFSPNVRHWLYTRSFDAVPILRKAKNLTINLSVDRQNYWRAGINHDLDGLRRCYLTDDGNFPGDLPEDSVIFPDYALRGSTPEGRRWFDALLPRNKAMTCPVDMWGKAEKRRCGPCDRCLK